MTGRHKEEIDPVRLLLAVVLLWALVGHVPLLVFSNWPMRGQYGDMFGVVNSLFSGLAFAGLLLAINLQRDELSLQRQELEQTRRELSRSAAAQEATEEAMRMQVEALKAGARLTAMAALLQSKTTSPREFEKSSELDVNKLILSIHSVLLDIAALDIKEKDALAKAKEQEGDNE